MNTPTLTKGQIQNFQKKIWKFYVAHKRSFPWRNTKDPYKIVVSEFMLQQTQVRRVIPKYEHFLKTFPTWQSLAKANYIQVYKEWEGLGYNRRAGHLRDLAKIVVKNYKGKLPADDLVLQTLPGIGPATSAAIVAFAFNLPCIYLETNVRSVYLHTFYRSTTLLQLQESGGISDRNILPLIKQTLDLKHPREWYYALLDYGAHIKTKFGNPNHKSKHYKKQSAFKNSTRQARGAVLKSLLQKPKTEIELQTKINHPKLPEILTSLKTEKLITLKKGTYHLN